MKVAKKTIEHINNTFNNDFSQIYLDSKGYHPSRKLAFIYYFKNEILRYSKTRTKFNSDDEKNIIVAFGMHGSTNFILFDSCWDNCYE